LPVAASNAETMPVMPSVNSLPPAKVGVDFGPFSWRAAAEFTVNDAG
jgi:hypothetical protein